MNKAKFKVGDKVELTPWAIVGDHVKRQIQGRIGTIIEADGEDFQPQIWIPGDWIVDFGLSRNFAMFEDQLQLALEDSDG